MTQLTHTLTQREVRGFALYVGITEAEAAAAGYSLAELASALRETLGRLVPASVSNSYAAVALAPAGVTGDNLAITRRALGLTDRRKPESDKPASGVVIDLSRQRVFVDGARAWLTEREFEILRTLVSHQGETIGRSELGGLSGLGAGEGRAVDVHIRRLRVKLGMYPDIVRTVRGAGYRFDAHPDVLVEA